MLIILVGKSGCGKSSIEKHFEKMISFTTRPPREGEVHGKDYYFYDRQTVENEIPKFKAKELTFIKQLSSYAGEHYGTSEEEVNRIKALDLAVAVMNSEGAKDMQRIMLDNGVEAKIVWVDIDENLRIKRITERMNDTGESLEQIKLRLNEDHRDSEKEQVDLIIENNGTLEEAIVKVRAITLEHQFEQLTIKAHYESLTADELKTYNDICKQLKIVACDVCNGEGIFYNPSIIGYGTEEGDCNTCYGLGVVNLSEGLFQTLIKERIEY